MIFNKKIIFFILFILSINWVSPADPVDYAIVGSSLPLINANLYQIPGTRRMIVASVDSNSYINLNIVDDSLLAPANIVSTAVVDYAACNLAFNLNFGVILTNSATSIAMITSSIVNPQNTVSCTGDVGNYNIINFNSGVATITKQASIFSTVSTCTLDRVVSTQYISSNSLLAVFMLCKKR